MVARHAINTGHGQIWTDRYPEPRLLFARSGHNASLAGDPEAVEPAALSSLLDVGVLDAPPDHLPLLRAAFDWVRIWERIIYVQNETATAWEIPGYLIRRLSVGDVPALGAFYPEGTWIWNTWTDAVSLAAGGTAWGAFEDERLVAVSCSFFVGDAYEDLGVVTDAAHRGRGLSSACTAHLCADIRARGRVPSWTTSTDNLASQRVAEKNGFRKVRGDVLYVINGEIPEP